MEWKELLPSLRKEKGLSQAELAEELGISRQAVSRWETGLAAPSSDNLIALSKIYGMTVEDLYTHFDLAEMEEKEEEPQPAIEESTIANPAQPKRKLWLWILLVIVCVYISIFLWGVLTNSKGLAIGGLFFLTLILLSTTVLYTAYFVIAYLRKEKK